MLIDVDLQRFVECSVDMVMTRIKDFLFCFGAEFDQSIIYIVNFYFEVSCSISFVRNILTEQNNMTEASNILFLINKHQHALMLQLFLMKHMFQNFINRNIIHFIIEK